MLKKYLLYFLAFSLTACGSGNDLSPDNNTNKDNKQLCEQKCKKNIMNWMEQDPERAKLKLRYKQLDKIYADEDDFCNKTYVHDFDELVKCKDKNEEANGKSFKLAQLDYQFFITNKFPLHSELYDKCILLCK